MAGRKPKPSKLKALEGNPGKRALNRDEPVMADLRDSEPPGFLCRWGKKEWRRVMGAAPSGLVTSADVSVLAAMCAAYGRWRKAHAALAKVGDVITMPSRYCQPHPYVAIEQRARKDFIAAAAEFGLSPSARSRVHVAPKADPGGAAQKFFRYGDAE